MLLYKSINGGFMNNLEFNLMKAKSICDGKFIYCEPYSRIYTFTTENINGYIKYFDLKNKSLLTVGSSGDQILNAYFYGARDITLFDINPYAKYYVYLKVAAILSLTYNEFQCFFFKRGIDNNSNKDVFSPNLFNKMKLIMKELDYESFYFFNELFSLYDDDTIRIRYSLFDDDEYRNVVIKNFNVYLRNEELYNKLKKKLYDIHFKYINGNIFEDNINLQYDNIFLSNLCTITNLKEFKELIKKLDFNNLKDNGSIMLGYLWDTNFNSDKYLDNWKEIYKLPITKEVLKKYITEHHSINCARDFLWEEDRKNDLVMIYRKK